MVAAAFLAASMARTATLYRPSSSGDGTVKMMLGTPGSEQLTNFPALKMEAHSKLTSSDALMLIDGCAPVGKRVVGGATNDRMGTTVSAKPSGSAMAPWMASAVGGNQAEAACFDGL